MVQRTLAAIGVGGMLFLCSSEAVRSDPGARAPVTNPSAGALTAFAHQSAFLDAHPGVAFSLSPEAGRIERVYGPAFSHGDTGAQSAEAFRLAHSRMFGAEPQDVVPVGPFRNGQHVQPIMYQPETDTYKFTGLLLHPAARWRAGLPLGPEAARAQRGPELRWCSPRRASATWVTSRSRPWAPPTRRHPPPARRR